MSRLIDADEAIDYVNALITVHRYYHPRSTTENFPISEVIARINEVPTVDAVPVVRCRDCKHKRMVMKSGCLGCDIQCCLHPYDWYCPDGEKVTE